MNLDRGEKASQKSEDEKEKDLLYPSVDAYIIYLDVTIRVMKNEICLPSRNTGFAKFNDVGEILQISRDLRNL